MASAADVRKQVILNALGKKPMTCQELADTTSLNYNTAYKSLRELQEAGLVHYTGQVRDKSWEWATGSTNGIPEFYDPAGNRKIAVDDIVVAFGQSRTAASVKAAVAFFETLEQLLRIAADPEGTTEADLKAIRNRTIVNSSFIKNLDGYYQQLLATQDFWSVEKLSVVGLLLRDKNAASAANNEELNYKT